MFLLLVLLFIFVFLTFQLNLARNFISVICEKHKFRQYVASENMENEGKCEHLVS